MLSHYLSIASRLIRKNSFYSVITVVGLSVGLAAVFLLLQFVNTELSYDRFNVAADRIYRIAWIDENPQTRTPHPMAMAMVHDFPEVESAVSMTPIWGPGLIRQTFSVRNLEKDIRYDESNVLSVDSTFFQVFTFPLVRGNAQTVLKNPEGILLSESMAKKYFGDDDPLGKRLAVNDDRNIIEVIGVFKDVPETSHFHFDILVSYVRQKQRDPGDPFYSWSDFGHYNYIRLKEGADAKQLESRLLDWIPKYLPWTPSEIQGMKSQGFGFRLQPLTDIHLQSNLHWELEANGNGGYVYLMGAAALLILAIACINFINLTTAQSTERAKEIGIRKTLGAFRKQLATQFIGETLIITAIAVVLAALLIELSSPFYSQFTGHALNLEYLPFVSGVVILGLTVGILAGAYPAWYLSSLKPGLILRSGFSRSGQSLIFRRSFIVFQFFASMILITGSLIIFQQLDYVRGKSLGFSTEAVLVLPVKNRGDINPRFVEMQSEMLRIPGVLSVTATSNVPGKSFNQNAIFPISDPQARINSSEAVVDYDFFNTLQVPFAEGRGFDRSNPADSSAFIINETAARELFAGSAVGKEIGWEREDRTLRGTVIGVVRDFNFQSLHEPVRPLIFRLSPFYNYVLVRTEGNAVRSLLPRLEQTWKKFDDRFGFEFDFLSDELNQQYRAEENMAGVMITFAFLAAAIACIGLLGIATLAFRQRIKEVSIRKVLGASEASLSFLLLSDFTRTILIAIGLATPAAFWLMSRWLQNFEFQVRIGPGVFVLAGAGLLIVAWATLGYLTLRVTRLNPAETLKSE